MTVSSRWILVALLLASTTLNYIDRQTISVLAPVLSEEFAITPVQYSWIVFAFLLAYSAMQAVAGRVVDWLGTRRGLALGVAWWSVAAMLHALGSGVLSFALFRFLLGTGEAANFPAALKAIAERFGPGERSLAVGIVTAGTGLGAIVAPPLVAWLALGFGWRAAFLWTGAIGFAWLALWLWFHAAERRAPAGLAGAVLARREADAPRDAGPGPVSGGLPASGGVMTWLRRRDVIGLMIARFVADGAFYFFVFWLPTYLAAERGFDLRAVGLFAWIPFAAADLGSLAGGWVGGQLIRAGLSLDASRKLVMWIGALLVPVAWPALGARSAGVAIALIALAMFAIQFKQAALFTIPADLFPDRHVATVWGWTGAAGSFGAMAFTPVVGWLVQYVSYEPVFAIVSAMHVVSTLAVVVAIPRIGPVEVEEERV